MSERIAVIGLGYVGLPVALALAKVFPGTVGFDINVKRVKALKQGIDATKEISSENLKNTALTMTFSSEDLKDITTFIVTVPTPIDANKQPDLTAIINVSKMIGKVLKPGTVIVYESTVYPGVTEEVCGPILAKTSGLKQSQDFKLAYSPERINPGDGEHSLTSVTKVVSAEDEKTLKKISEVYSKIIAAGIHQAPSIKVAEAAKVIENTQRDLNIALMNELALIFDKIGIRTCDVLEAAKTKWNFLPFSPGLVGGHCIEVDPYYLTAKAESLGYHPQIILAGRRINDSMGGYIAQRLVKLLIQADIPVKKAKVAILGLTFKENVPDLRNSRVSDIIAELQQFGIEPMVHDPLADVEEAKQEYKVALHMWEDLADLDGVILAVPHQEYCKMSPQTLLAPIKNGGVCVDVKAMMANAEIPRGIHYWCL